MRALAVAKASVVQQGGKEKSSKKQRKTYKISKDRKRNSPSEALAAFRYSTHSLPKATNFFIKFCSGIAHEYQHAKNRSKYASILTHIVGGACGLMGLKRSTGVR
jgi:hypothetical protein